MYSFSLGTCICFVLFQPYLSLTSVIYIHDYNLFFLKIASPRIDKACREIWQLVRSDYDIKMLKFTSLPSILTSIIYPINLRLKMLHMIPVSLEVNLNGSLSRLKACYSVDYRNATFSNSLSHFHSFCNLNLIIYY